jgi:hypothetical protein
MKEERRGFSHPSERNGGGTVCRRGCPGFGTGTGIRVTLLGTGCPPPVMNRFGLSTLVEAGGKKLLFDAGRGAPQRLTQLKVR